MSETVESGLARLASAVGVPADRQVLSKCADYVRLLARWNARMNLTALPLGDTIPDSTLLKLVIEPLVAAPFFPEGGPTLWLDLGSGGGSPAIPLRIVRPAGSLTMVEARSRKCAFLREAVRTLGLARTDVQNVRFEELTAAAADVVTIRAVRVDGELADIAAKLLAPGGTVLCFGSDVPDQRFVRKAVAQLPDGSELGVFHVEH